MYNKKSQKIKVLVGLLICFSTLNACSNSNPTTTDSTINSATVVTKANVVENYANLVLLTYMDSLEGIKKLQSEVNKFIANPSKEGLESTKQAWLKARIPYGQSESFRFYDGPIDRETGPELRINSWPLDEVFIDYVEVKSVKNNVETSEKNNTVGIINNPSLYPVIDENLLKENNQKGGDKNISTGFHAVEFLLWGQDLSDGAGAGQRQYTDYLTNELKTNLNQERRKEYLKVSTDLLVEDMQTLVNEWSKEKSDNYRAEFLKLTSDESLTKILRGVGTLSASELSNQRMATPLDVGEREEEHSCFSDSTQSDILQNTKSIDNVLMGTYTSANGQSVKGASIYNLINQTNKDLADKLSKQLLTSKNLVEKIKNPFDQEIKPDNSEGNKRVRDTINSLQAQGITIVEVGSALGLTINTKS